MGLDYDDTWIITHQSDMECDDTHIVKTKTRSDKQRHMNCHQIALECDDDIWVNTKY